MSLLQYTREATDQLFDKMGAFYAFSKQTLSEKCDPNLEYVSLGYGLIVPQKNAKALVEELESINKFGIARDLEVNGKQKIIRRELYNFECLYTWDITDCVEALEAYGISREEIQAVFDDELKTH